MEMATPFHCLTIHASGSALIDLELAFLQVEDESLETSLHRNDQPVCNFIGIIADFILVFSPVKHSFLGALSIIINKH